MYLCSKPHPLIFGASLSNVKSNTHGKHDKIFFFGTRSLWYKCQRGDGQTGKSKLYFEHHWFSNNFDLSLVIQQQLSNAKVHDDIDSDSRKGHTISRMFVSTISRMNRIWAWGFQSSSA